jgi:hypothetical protein
MPALATLQTWLEEAYAARHKLRTGALAVSLSYGQRTMSYTAANAADLDAYISDLEQQIREAQGSTNKRRVFRAMQTGTGY